jgi:hypothetical protein
MATNIPQSLRHLTKRRFLDVLLYLSNAKIDLKNGLPEKYKVPLDAKERGLTVYDFELVAECYKRAHSKDRDRAGYFGMLMSRLYAELRSTDITTNDESINQPHDKRLEEYSQETLDKMEKLLLEDKSNGQA